VRPDKRTSKDAQVPVLSSTQRPTGKHREAGPVSSTSDQDQDRRLCSNVTAPE
jgi:hypothetical protein